MERSRKEELLSFFSFFFLGGFSQPPRRHDPKENCSWSIEGEAASGSQEKGAGGWRCGHGKGFGACFCAVVCGVVQDSKADDSRDSATTIEPDGLETRKLAAKTVGRFGDLHVRGNSKSAKYEKERVDGVLGKWRAM